MGKSMFIDVRDQSGRLQAYAQKNVLGDEQFDLFRHLDLGDFIGVKGTLFTTKTGEISVRLTSFVILAKALSGGQGAHVVYDSVGQATIRKSIQAVRPRGLCVLCGNSSGLVDTISPMDLAAAGSIFFTRPRFSHHIQTRDAIVKRAQDIFSALGDGKLRVKVCRIFPLEQATEAHRLLQSRSTIGKIMLYVILAGLVGYGLWGFIRAIVDPLHKGTDAKGIAERIGYAISGISYWLLALPTYNLITAKPGAAQSGAQTAQTQKTTADILSNSWGPWVIGIVAVSCLAAATFGVTSSYLSGLAPSVALVVNWFTWYLGDLAGAIVVTPLLLTWSKWLEFRLRSRRILEAVLMLVLLLVVSWALFGSGQFRDWLGAYTFIPFLIWAAFRFGQNGTALSALVVAGIAIWGTIQGLGPFVGETPNASLLSLQAFVCIATATGLLLSAALAERKQAEAALRGARDGLELRVQERTTQLDRANRDLQAEITERKRAYEVAEGRRIDLERELLVAHDVQASLIPRDMPDVPGFGLAGAWIPANEVAGDFYDIFPLPDGLWGIVIGDVADKGAAAVLYMAMVRSLILSAALRHRGPAAVLMEVNRTILIQYPEAMFATIFLAVFDPKQQTFQYANAGHNPPMVRCGSGPIESLTRTGTVVGMFAELELSEATITLGRGDAVILFTDGVTEAINPREEEYGADRLTAAITAAPRKASELLAHVEADLNAFTEGAPQHDDITFFVLTKD